MSSTPEVGHEKEKEAEEDEVTLKPVKPESAAEDEVTLKPVKPESAAEDEVTLKPVKPEAAVEGGSAYIHIKVTRQTFPDAFVRTKRNVLLQRVMDKYCGKHSLMPNAVVFLNEDGKYIRPSQTAEEAGLDDGHSISVNIAQLGGSGRCSA